MEESDKGPITPQRKTFRSTAPVMVRGRWDRRLEGYIGPAKNIVSFFFLLPFFFAGDMCTALGPVGTDPPEIEGISSSSYQLASDSHDASPFQPSERGKARWRPLSTMTPLFST